MTDLLKQRVQERLRALDISAFEAARRAGFERTFINDLLIGKKRSIGVKNIPRVAEALECDPRYLMGHIHAPHGPQNPEHHGSDQGVPISGVCEAGVWRESPAAPAGGERPVPADPRYAADAQMAFIVRGDHAEKIGLSDGSVALAVAGLPYRDGDTVIARRSRNGAGDEFTIRVIQGDRLELKGAPESGESIGIDEAEIVGVVIMGLRIF